MSGMMNITNDARLTSLPRIAVNADGNFEVLVVSNTSRERLLQRLAWLGVADAVNEITIVKGNHLEGGFNRDGFRISFDGSHMTQEDVEQLVQEL